MKETIDIDEIFGRLLNRQMFQREKDKETTIAEKISESSRKSAQITLSKLISDSNSDVNQIIEKVQARAISWGYDKELQQYKTTRRFSSENEAGRWIQDNITFETKRAMRQKETADDKLKKLKEEVLSLRIKSLKEQKTEDEYKDAFNRLVCRIADKKSISLPDAERIAVEKIQEDIIDKDVQKFLTLKRKGQTEKNLKQSLSKNLTKLGDPEIAATLTAILFEIEEIKTDNVWGLKRFEEILISGLNGERINLITVLCLINKFDDGNYTAIPNLDAYLENLKLEPIPLIVDEIASLTTFFAFYGIDTSLAIYVADTDYTEIGQYGPVNNDNLKNIKTYIENLKRYLSKYPKIKIAPISEITSNNNKYQEVKSRILGNLNGFRNRDFENKYSKKFEDAREKVWESQIKKALFPENEIRSKSLEITKNIWACNAAQGAVFASLEPNTILISTERRERDMNYIIDGDIEKRFIPVLYILKAAEMWNRKLTTKNANIE